MACYKFLSAPRPNASSDKSPDTISAELLHLLVRSNQNAKLVSGSGKGIGVFFTRLIMSRKQWISLKWGFVARSMDKARLPFPRSQHRWQPCFPVQRRSFGPGSGCRVQEVFGRRMRITTLAVARSGTVPAAPRGCNHKVEAALRHHLVAVNDQRSVISLASLGDAESYLLSIDCNYPRRK